MPSRSLVRLALATCAGGALGYAGDAPLTVAEPAKASAPTPRKTEPGRWSWGQAPAEVVPTGDLRWKPEPFMLELGKTVRYIDFDGGNDDAEGTKDKPWKHHPWDAQAGGKAKASNGPVTYVFKGGVIYRGELMTPSDAGGTEAEPVRLTSDPAWGKGEAVIAGSEQVTGWKQGADRGDIPDAPKVWYADLDFLPRNVWVRDGDKIERVQLARTPNWKVSDPDDVRSEWWTFQMPNWWENGCGKWKINHDGHRAYDGVDAAHLTAPAESYVGAIAHVEYGWMMGTPFPTKVEGFDPGNKGIIFQGIWWGDSENVVGGCHYFLEDKPNFLDSDGEFWFDKDKKRLYLRLPGDKDPNTAKVEVAKHCNLIESMGLAHTRISGLSFRFTNTTWDLELPPWMNPDINNAAIRIRGRAEDVRIANCRFDHCAKAVRIDTDAYQPEHRAAQPMGEVLIADNDIDEIDHGAMEVRTHAVGNLRILRNHLHQIGLRTYRQDFSHALVVHGAETCEIAGNFLERTYGAGIFCEGQGGGDDKAPLSRNLVHHNRAVDTLLWAWDWGGIETNGAPFMNFDNVSLRPHGMMFGYDGNKNPASGVGMAYYWDHGHAIYGFNLIAAGGTDDWKSKIMSHAGLYEASATTENHLFNSTIYRFWYGSLWSPVAGRHAILGTIFDDIGGMAFHHGPLKEDKATAAVYPHASMAYGHNVFSRVPQAVEKGQNGETVRAFALYEATGAAYDSLDAMAKSFAAHPALAGDVGVMAKESPLRDPDKGDFRPKPGSEAIDHGVKMFVPWTLALTIGEWHFRRNNSDPAVLIDDHFCNVPYMTGENQYSVPVFNLAGHGITAKDYGAGPLEDWCDGALTLDGKEQYASLAQSEMVKPFTWDAGNNQKKTAQGKEIVSPDIDGSSLLIEAYVMTKQSGGVLVAKRQGNGYQLALNKAGGVTLTLLGGGQKAELASGARIADGKWHHVLAEFDRAHGTGAIYTDGTRSAEGKLELPKDASLSNDGDLLVGKGPDGDFFAGTFEFLRIARTTLAESKTSIEELYDWEFDGPFLRDFAGKPPTGKCRDAGALEADK
jgi:hypothetical protein